MNFSAQFSSEFPHLQDKIVALYPIFIHTHNYSITNMPTYLFFVNFLRYDRLNHTRSDSDLHTNSDLMHRALVTGDLEIGNIMAKNKIPMRKKKKVEKLKKLPILARSLVKNPEKFNFEDPIETQKDLDKIKVAPIDPKALMAIDTGKKQVCKNFTISLIV